MDKINIIGLLIMFIIGILLDTMGYGFKTWQFYIIITLTVIYGLTRFAIGVENE